VIDIQDVFMTSNGELGMQAVLKECSYSKEHNFNLLGMSKLLHKQGWKITCSDESLIRIKNEKIGVINFDIMVPTEKGAVYVCKFVQGTEIASACTTTGTRMNINTTHCLLGHRNEDSIRKTAKQMGWELTRGSLRLREVKGKTKKCMKGVGS
jgi:hypothetical protein